jgi:uncharacterized protein YacL
MNRFIKPVSLIFYLLSILVAFFIGSAFAGFSGAADGQGLAGGAIVFMYGIMFAFSGLIIALFVVYYLQHKTIVVANRVLIILVVIIAGIFIYRFSFGERNATPDNATPKTKTSPVS